MSAANRPLLLLAPHLEWPARNGADVTHVELARALSRTLPYVDVVGVREGVRYRDGAETERHPFSNRMRSRPGAALRTVARRSHYYLEKFLTPGFRREAARHLADPAYGAVLHSYLTTATLADLPDPGRRHLVWTHNDEFAWFEDLGREARSPAGRLVAAASGRWLTRFLARHGRDVTLLHVTEADRYGWSRHASHDGHVVPIGVAMRDALAPPTPPGAPVHLVFVGALGVRMNLDALRHFAERFAPALRDRLGASLRVSVAGSSPLPEVGALCEAEGWALRPNLSDEALDRLFDESTFSLLPFAYATGAKLKLLKSLSYGVPVLATTAVGAQRDLVAPPSLLSDAPEVWAAHVAETQAHGLSAADRDRLGALAAAHSWDASARRLLDIFRA